MLALSSGNPNQNANVEKKCPKYRGSPTSTVSISTISTSTNFIAIGIKLVLVGD